MSCARRPGAVGGGGTPGPAATPPMNGANAATSLIFCQLAMPGGEHQRLGIDAAVAEVRDDLVLRDRTDLVSANRHVPLL